MLEIKREDLGKSKIRLNVKVPQVMMRGFFQSVYEKMAPGVEVKGFRKGHAPKSLAISAIGENRLMQEIIDLALQETYSTVLKQEDLLPVSPPKISIKMMKDLLTDTAELEYEAEVDLLPEVEIGDYKKSIKALKPIKPKEKNEAKPEEIEQVLSHLQRQHATFEDKDGNAENGDRLEINFEGSERGVVLENLTSKNYPVILGAKTLLPEFEEKLIGLKKDQEKEFDLEIGSASPPAGGKKKVHFKVKVLNLQKVILPELDDNLAQKFQKKTLSELKKAVEEDIVRQKEIETKRAKESQIVDLLFKLAKLEVAESLVEQEAQRMVDDLKNQVTMAGMPFDQYLAQIKKTEADLQTDFKEQAEKTVKIGLILGEIAKAEKMDLKDEQVGKKVMEKLLEFAKK